MNVFGWFDVSGWLIAVVVILATTYWYFSQKKSIFEKIGVPAPRPYPIIGNLTFKTNVELVETELIKKYGPIVGFEAGSIKQLLVADPDLLRQIFVKDTHVFTNRLTFGFTEKDILNKMVSLQKGEQWKMTRSILSPTFSASKIKKMMPLITESTEILVKNFSTLASKNEKFELKSVYGKFTMDVIAKTMFGIDIDCQTKEDSEFIKYAQEAFDFEKKPILMLLVMIPSLMPLLSRLGYQIIDRRITDFFFKITKDVIEIRKKGEKEYNDFIQLMLNAHKDEEFLKYTEQESEGSKAKLQRGLSDEDILAQSLVFYLAGYETMATLLSWASYCLAVNQHVQDRLREEISSRYGDQEVIGYDDIHNFEYLDNVVNEVLRMHPPALRLDRVNEEEYDLAGYKIPPGIDIQAPIYYMHHNPEWWDEPSLFKPERFEIQNKSKRSPYVFIPFGLGPRNCIGMRFALIEAKVALVSVLRKVRFVLAPGTPEKFDPLDNECKFKKNGFHYPEVGLWLKAETVD